MIHLPLVNLPLIKMIKSKVEVARDGMVKKKALRGVKEIHKWAMEALRAELALLRSSANKANRAKMQTKWKRRYLQVNNMKRLRFTVEKNKNRHRLLQSRAISSSLSHMRIL